MLSEENIILAGGNRPKREKRKPPGGGQKKEQQQPRQRWTDPVAEKAVKDKLFEIELRPNTESPSLLGFPIRTVIESISEEKASNSFQGGYASFWKLARAAENKTLNIEGIQDFNALKSACAEAIMYQVLFNSPQKGHSTRTTATVYDPIRYGEGLKDLLPDFAKPFAKKIIESTSGKTPDILSVSLPFTYTDRKGTKITNSPGIAFVIDPKDPQAKRIIGEVYKDKTLIMPVEVTLSKTPRILLDKVDKANTYRNPFIKSNEIVYMPVLIVDQDKFLNLDLKDRVKIVQGMQAAGGRIQVIKDLDKISRLYAQAISVELIQAVELAKLLEPKKPYQKHQQPPEQKKSLFNKLFDKPIKQVQKLFQKNKTQETAETQKDNKIPESIQKESAADTYEKMVLKLKSKPEFFEKINVKDPNTNHINLMVASYAIQNNLDYAEILKQSDSYSSASTPTLAATWLNKTIEDAWALIDQNNLNTPDAQKILQSYNKKKVRDNASSDPKKQNVDEFDRVAAVIKENNMAFEKMGLNVLDNRAHLLIALGIVGKYSGEDPTKFLKLSPEYAKAETLGKGETLLDDIVEAAESVAKEEDSKAAQVVQANSQPELQM
jgi:hypothetical protein